MFLEAKQKVISACNTAFEILALYYDFSEPPEFSEFLLAPCQQQGGQTLFEEIPPEELFIGIRFGLQHYQNLMEKDCFIPLNEVAIFAEETSHFLLLMDAFLLKSSLSLLQLETLGEIDRFLTVMHWNATSKDKKIKNRWQNLHQICDDVFAGDRFPVAPKTLYFDAESLALKHLKEAFAQSWDNTYFDFKSIDKEAKFYLKRLRKSILEKKDLKVAA